MVLDKIPIFRDSRPKIAGEIKVVGVLVEKWNRSVLTDACKSGVPASSNVGRAVTGSMA